MYLSKQIKHNLCSNVLQAKIKIKINNWCDENILYVSTDINLIISESNIEGHYTGYFPLDNEINSLEHSSHLGKEITICIDTHNID